MRTSLHIAILAGLVASAVPALRAQLHSPQVTLHRAERAEDLSWLNAYASPEPGSDEAKLALDPRFRPLLQQHLTTPQTFWGKDRPLSEVATDYLTGQPGAVITDENRYLSADASVREFPADRGLLWVDLGVPHPLLVFAAIEWISDNKTLDQADAAYTLWVFSNRALSTEHLLPALRRSVARWTAKPVRKTGALENITRVYVVDPDGTPHPINPASIGAHNELPAETESTLKVGP